MLVTVNPIPGSYYNIGGSYSCTVGKMLNYLISLSYRKNEIKIEQDPERTRPLDADLQIPNTLKFQNHTGWKPEIPFEKTMGDLLNYWRNQINNQGAFLTR
jgi:GDPmannose 4,6-dehydratase